MTNNKLTADKLECDCETCGGTGKIDERLGGYSFSNPAAKCPDCDGDGVYYSTPQATQAWRDVVAERQRQVTAEGWSISRDDNYVHRQLMWAAVTYCFSAANDRKYAERFWPWDNDWFKPTDERRDLVKAGALILAEIERIDRAAVEGDKQ